MLVSHLVSASPLPKNFILMDIYHSLSCFPWEKAIKIRDYSEIMGTN